jgi:predicted metal-dependent hydrolase
MESLCAEAPPPELVAGIEQFNRGEYFEQHETLELLWRAERRPVRDLYQGILQVGVGLYHIRRHNYRGATDLLGRGLARLPAFAPACMNINVARLIEDTQRCYDSLLALRPERISEFDWSKAPLVHWAT